MDISEWIAIIDTVGVIGSLLWMIHLRNGDLVVERERHDAETAYWRAEHRRLCNGKPTEPDVIDGGSL